MKATEVVGGRFRLVNPLGRGATSVVWKAIDESTNAAVALKVLAPEVGGDPSVQRRFFRECEVLARCRSAHVVRVIVWARDPRRGPYLAMELLQGETLEDRLRRVGAMPRAMFLPIADGIVKGLTHLHRQGLVHRDLKPANVFLAADYDSGVQSKLMDFGTVKVPRGDAHGRTGEGVLLGTPSRMSPEQARGGTIDVRTDVWALGMLAFEALVGAPAIDGSLPPGQVLLTVCFALLPVPSELHAGLDAAFDAWFARSTARDPEQRFVSVGQQWHSLQAVLSSRKQTAPESRGDGPGRHVVIRVKETLSLPPLVPRGEDRNSLG